jgi:hypothetical protein
MESIVQSSETTLLGSLNFTPGKAGPYVQDRKSVQIHPGSGNYFSPNGIRTIRWTLAGSDWLVPETIRLGFTIRNEDAVRNLQPVSCLPGTLFSRIRILSNGVLLEDMNLYNRQVNTFHNMLAPERQYMDASEGFGVTGNTPGLSAVEWIPEQIPAGGERRVFMTLMSGLFSQHLWLPLPYFPITIEAELGNFDQAFAPNYHAPGAGAAVQMSQHWSINDARVYCDLCQLDASLQSSYASHLASGKSLPLAFSSFVTQTQRSEGAAQTLVLARSFTRLKGIFVTWFKGNDASGLRNASNFMYHHHGAGAYNHVTDSLEVQMQLGAKKYPEYPMSSLAEFYYRLRLAVGAHFGDVPINVLPHEFRSAKFMVAVDLEKAASGPAGGVSFSGISSRGGELLTIDYKGFGVPDADVNVSTTPTQSFIHLNFDAICEIRIDGVSVSD